MCKSVINAINFASGGGSVATGVLQIAGGVALDGTLRAVEDQDGTDSLLQLSTAAVNIGSGTITNNGILTIKGSGANIISFRNALNAEVGNVSNGGNAAFNGNCTILGGYTSYGTNEFYGALIVSQNIRTNAKYLFNGTGSTTPALKQSGEYVYFEKADGSTGFTGLAAGEGTKKGISVIKGGTNTPYVGFFDADEIAQPTTAIAEATLVGNGGATITNTDTFGGYTLQQITQALKDLGLLA